MRDYTLYIRDILEAMEAIEKFVEGIDFSINKGFIKDLQKTKFYEKADH